MPTCTSTRPRWALLLGGVALLASLLPATTAHADVPGPITSRVDALLSAGGGTTGVYLKEVGGSVLAAKNETFPFEPASTIKVLPHLYAHVQAQAGAITLNDPVNLYSGVNTSCPADATSMGTEPMSLSLGKMMRVSDNPATRAQLERWTQSILADELNAYAANVLGTGQTNIVNILGCHAPGATTVDDNTSSLVDLGIMYGGVADGSLLTGGFRDSFYELMSGREQFETFGSDFTGIWPKLLTMVDAEAPAGMPSDLIDDFKEEMTANHKGGSYGICADNECTNVIEYLSFAGSAVVPRCQGGAVVTRDYVWGIFIEGAVNPNPGMNGATAAAAALGDAAGEPLREQIAAALAGWGACYPPDVTVSTVPSAPPAGQDGWFNSADVSTNGGAITALVSATDDSGVTDLLCTDNGGPVAVLHEGGSDPRTGSVLLVTDGVHEVVCEATDGMAPPHTGASTNAINTATVAIDATAPTLDCQPAEFLLGGPGGQVTATVSDVLSGPMAPLVSAQADVSQAGVQTVALTGFDRAGNSTTADCTYVVGYDVLGPFAPLAHQKVHDGATIVVSFTLADADSEPIPDFEAQALADDCAVRLTSTTGTPSPDCASYVAGVDQFRFRLPIPKGTDGHHTIGIEVFDGPVAITIHAFGVDVH